MWNRVLLAISGYCLGWFAVSALACPLAERPRHLSAIVVSGIVGLAAILWLGIGASLAAGVAGAVVYLAIALVGYMGNARRVSQVEPELPPRRPVRPVAVVDQTAVVLIWEGEPRHYDGPELWARRFRALAAKGQRVPHWFVRPLVYARIRSAYRAMGGENCTVDAVAALARTLEARLGLRYRVQEAALSTAAGFPDTLICLVEQGYLRLVLAPVGMADDVSQVLREHVARSRVREVGAEVIEVPSLPPSIWAPTQREENLERLTHGMPIPSPAEAREEVVELLSKQVSTAVTKSN